MIVSASRRTDIPAFFGEWFYNRIKEGFVLVRNPMNIYQISRIKITPDIVDCIVFWTKNPRRFIEKLHLLEMYSYYFQYTITGYGKILEPNVPKLEEATKYFVNLSEQIGKNKVIWRYDPIIITETQSIKFHLLNFEFIAQHLSGYTNRCVISFVDYYKKTMKNLSGINYNIINEEQIKELSYHLNCIAKKYQITLSTCAEEIDLAHQGIQHGKCIDDKLIEEISGSALKISKDKNQRNECGCVASIDIGAYNTCLHGCLYCYANFNSNQVRSNYSQYKKDSPLLVGTVTTKDKITEKKVISCKLLQETLFR
jgi:DNA repair photolyase